MLWYELDIKDLKSIVIDDIFSWMCRAHVQTGWCLPVGKVNYDVNFFTNVQ